MDIQTINAKLALGELDENAMFPRLSALKSSLYIFKFDFGLDELPSDPGILLIRGARQYGKSTWLEQQICLTIKQFGAGTAFYLNGENLANHDQLEQAIDELLASFNKESKVRRIFVDEITAINKWEIALKRMADRGKLSNVLIVTTGSKATDLRRGSERLPGRKGKLQRTTYLFTPISYKEFHRIAEKKLKNNTLISYLISGGSPIACSELIQSGSIPDYVIELTRDWIEGEISASGRNRSALINLMSVIFRMGGSPVGHAKLAREAGLANNSVAAGYIELLNDLGAITPAYPWDADRKILILRKPCKFHLTNMLVAATYHNAHIRSVSDFLDLPNNIQGMWYEWFVAQELSRRNAIKGEDILAPLSFWQSKEHEIDFVTSLNTFIGVKRGSSSPLEFSWFIKQFKQKKLIVLNNNNFETESIEGLSIENFLLDNMQ